MRTLTRVPKLKEPRATSGKMLRRSGGGKVPTKWERYVPTTNAEKRASRQALLMTPSKYEGRNKRSGRGLRLLLSPGVGGGVFWSKGWRACTRCSGSVTDWEKPLRPFRERRPDGTIVSGWRCK